MSLTTPQEIKFKTPISKQFSGVEFEPIIDMVEIGDFSEIFTHTFYCELHDDLVDYSGAELWASGTTYAVDAVVKYDDRIWVAQAETTKPPPCSDWDKAPKFNTQCYNDIWESGKGKGFLGQYLCLIVLRAASPFIATKMSPNGFTQNLSGELKYQPASDKARQATIKGIESLIENIYKEVIRFIHRSEDACFDALKDCLPCVAKDCCDRIYVNDNVKRKSRYIVGGPSRTERAIEELKKYREASDLYNDEYLDPYGRY